MFPCTLFNTRMFDACRRFELKQFGRAQPTKKRVFRAEALNIFELNIY